MLRLRDLRSLRSAGQRSRRIALPRAALKNKGWLDWNAARSALAMTLLNLSAFYARHDTSSRGRRVDTLGLCDPCFADGGEAPRLFFAGAGVEKDLGSAFWRGRM
jgi:hypothetical protein